MNFVLYTCTVDLENITFQKMYVVIQNCKLVTDLLTFFYSVTHATNCIIKPISKTQEAAQREIEEAMKKVKEAQSLITAAVDEPSQ